jgi:hypothetical protein
MSAPRPALDIPFVHFAGTSNSEVVAPEPFPPSMPVPEPEPVPASADVPSVPSVPSSAPTSLEGSVGSVEPAFAELGVVSDPEQAASAALPASAIPSTSPKSNFFMVVSVLPRAL